MAKTRKPWKQPKRVSTGVTNVLEKMELAGRLVDLKVREAWGEAVGESIARRSSATELARGTLYVIVESPTWENELRFIEKEIVERVNARYRELAPGLRGDAASPVKRLRLSRGVLPAPRPKPKEKAPLPRATAEDERAVAERLEGITDPELRESARTLLLKAVAVDKDPASKRR